MASKFTGSQVTSLQESFSGHSTFRIIVGRISSAVHGMADKSAPIQEYTVPLPVSLTSSFVSMVGRERAIQDNAVLVGQLQEALRPFQNSDDLVLSGVMPNKNGGGYEFVFLSTHSVAQTVAETMKQPVKRYDGIVVLASSSKSAPRQTIQISSGNH